MYIYTVPHGGFGIDVLDNSLKVTLGTEEECSFALKTEIDSQDAANGKLTLDQQAGSPGGQVSG